MTSMKLSIVTLKQTSEAPEGLTKLNFSGDVTVVFQWRKIMTVERFQGLN